MKVVVDANAVIGLSRGRCFDLLRSLFAQVLVTPGVIDEVVYQGQGLPGATELNQAVDQWIETGVPSVEALNGLAVVRDGVDREVLALAAEAGADYLVTDDHVLRMTAVSVGQPLLYVAEVLLLGKLSGHLPQVRPIMDAMRTNGFGIRNDVYLKTLKQAGEAP